MPATANRPSVLVTARLRIRPFAVPGDEAFIVALLNDPGWLRHIGDKQVHDQAGARRYLEAGPLAMYAQHGLGLCAVERRADGRTIGMCGLIRRDGLDDVDLGFAFLPEGRGQGHAVEAAQAVLRHGFEAHRLARVVAICDPANTASQRVLAAIGMRHVQPTRLPGGEKELALWAAVPATSGRPTPSPPRGTSETGSSQ